MNKVASGKLETPIKKKPRKDIFQCREAISINKERERKVIENRREETLKKTLQLLITNLLETKRFKTEDGIFSTGINLVNGEPFLNFYYGGQVFKLIEFDNKTKCGTFTTPTILEGCSERESILHFKRIAILLSCLLERIPTGGECKVRVKEVDSVSNIRVKERRILVETSCHCLDASFGIFFLCNRHLARRNIESLRGFAIIPSASIAPISIANRTKLKDPVITRADDSYPSESISVQQSGLRFLSSKRDLSIAMLEGRNMEIDKVAYSLLLDKTTSGKLQKTQGITQRTLYVTMDHELKSLKDLIIMQDLTCNVWKNGCSDHIIKNPDNVNFYLVYSCNRVDGQTEDSNFRMHIGSLCKGNLLINLPFHLIHYPCNSDQELDTGNSSEESDKREEEQHGITSRKELYVCDTETRKRSWITHKEFLEGVKEFFSCFISSFRVFSGESVGNSNLTRLLWTTTPIPIMRFNEEVDIEYIHGPAFVCSSTGGILFRYPSVEYISSCFRDAIKYRNLDLSPGVPLVKTDEFTVGILGKQKSKNGKQLEGITFKVEIEGPTRTFILIELLKNVCILKIYGFSRRMRDCLQMGRKYVLRMLVILEGFIETCRYLVSAPKEKLGIIYQCDCDHNSVYYSSPLQHLCFGKQPLEDVPHEMTGISFWNSKLKEIVSNIDADTLEETMNIKASREVNLSLNK